MIGGESIRRDALAGGRGLYAMADIADGELLLAIPHASTKFKLLVFPIPHKSVLDIIERLTHFDLKQSSVNKLLSGQIPVFQSIEVRNQDGLISEMEERRTVLTRAFSMTRDDILCKTWLTMSRS